MPAHRGAGEILRPAGIAEASKLGGDEDPRVRFLEEAADQPLAAAGSIDVRRVEKIGARLVRGTQRGEGGVLRDLAPIGTQLPRAQSLLACGKLRAPKNP